MIHGQRVVVVLPSYNAERTPYRVVAGLPRDIAEDIVLVDDKSLGNMVALRDRSDSKRSHMSRILARAGVRRRAMQRPLREGPISPSSYTPTTRLAAR